MTKQAVGYNGGYAKEKFYKVKKHWDLMSRRMKFSSELGRARLENHPALTQIVEAIIQVKQAHYSDKELQLFEELEDYRDRLTSDERPISYEVFQSSESYQVHEILQRSSSSRIWSQLLYALSKKGSFWNFLEMGTNLGISGSYILSALREQDQGHFISMEAVPGLCEIAQEQFETLMSPDRFEIIQGLFDDTFSYLLSKAIRFDAIFIDGNHQEEPTWWYFQHLKEKILYPAVFIFDDINHSVSMQRVWKKIQSDASVAYTVDLFKMGIAVIDPSAEVMQKHFRFFITY